MPGKSNDDGADGKPSALFADAWYPAHRGDKRCSVRRLSGGRSRVSLRGVFRPGWLAHLATRLAAQGVSIESAHAKRRLDGQWSAEVDLSSQRDIDLEALPYLDLAEADGLLESSRLAIASFVVSTAAENEGWLKLDIDAEDSLGLLGRLLSALASVVLFPVELRIDTVDGKAYDTLWLASINGASVSPAALAMVRELMRRAVSPAG